MALTAVDLRHSAPETFGIASSNILAFIDAVEAEGLELHSLVLLKHGRVLAEGWWAPYRKEDVHVLWSLSKSFTSTAIGFAIQEKRLTLDDAVVSFFPDQTPENPSANLRAMKVRHLLSMSTGQAADDLAGMHSREDGDWVRGFLAREVVYEPGTQFLYNSGASYVLSAIISRMTGDSALEYLRPRLLEPLGIDNLTWETCPKGISSGGWGMSVTTEAIAKFGQFYLQRGSWEHKQLLSEAWIDEATRAHVSNGDDPESDWNQGYGFQFWRCKRNCYRGDGAFGQYCVVIPKLEMVVAITASVGDLQAVLNLVWKYLHDPAKAGHLPHDHDAHRALKARLSSLSLPPPAGEVGSSIGMDVSGKMYKRRSGRTDLQTCVFDFGKEGCTLTMRFDGGDRSIRACNATWMHGVTSLEVSPGRRIAAMGRWPEPNVYEMKIRYTESPAGLTLTTRFEGNSVKIVLDRTARFDGGQEVFFEGIAPR